jgi:hypothetical protein
VGDQRFVDGVEAVEHHHQPGAHVETEHIAQLVPPLLQLPTRVTAMLNNPTLT